MIRSTGSLQKLGLAGLMVSLLTLVGCSKAPTPPGQLYDVGGFKMHMVCSGQAVAGQPTVILENGSGMTAVQNYFLQADLAKSVRVCSYDRAGTGASESSDAPPDAANVTQQLHALLRAAKVKPPYVLSGHSLGAQYALVFTKTFPDEVVGLALLDPGHPEQVERVPAMAAFKNSGEATKVMKIARYGAMFGVLSWILPDPKDTPSLAKLPPDVLAQLRVYNGQSRTYASALALNAAFDDIARQTKAALNSVGDRPLVVVSTRGTAKDAQEAIAADNLPAEFIPLHEELAHLSPRGRHVFFDGATHTGLITDPTYATRAAAEILKVVQEASAGR